jgi:hypothetical protein
MSDPKTFKVPPGPLNTPGTAPAKPAPGGHGAAATLPAKPGAPAVPAKPGGAAVPAKPGASPSPGGPTGKVVHDERGNAVWDWLKQTGRIAIESTSRLLRRLETPELKVEDTQDNELRLMPDGKTCAGGGYDPYNQTNKGKPGRK